MRRRLWGFFHSFLMGHIWEIRHDTFKRSRYGTFAFVQSKGHRQISPARIRYDATTRDPQHPKVSYTNPGVVWETTFPGIAHVLGGLPWKPEYWDWVHRVIRQLPWSNEMWMVQTTKGPRKPPFLPKSFFEISLWWNWPNRVLNLILSECPICTRMSKTTGAEYSDESEIRKTMTMDGSQRQLHMRGGE